MSPNETFMREYGNTNVCMLAYSSRCLTNVSKLACLPPHLSSQPGTLPRPVSFGRQGPFVSLVHFFLPDWLPFFLSVIPIDSPSHLSLPYTSPNLNSSCLVSQVRKIQAQKWTVSVLELKTVMVEHARQSSKPAWPAL